MKQAKRGGEMVQGVYYPGGQFMPTDETPKHGKYNRRSKAKKPAKVQIGPNEWVEKIDGRDSIYEAIAGTVAKFTDSTKTVMVFCASAQTMQYFGYDAENVQKIIEA